MITVNNLKSVSVAYGSVPAAFGTLLALGGVYTYNHLVVVSTLDQDVVIKIGDNEITFPANKNVTLDNFPHNGTITYKYASAPSSGNLYVMCY
jgi:hypothetical protein